MRWSILKAIVVVAAALGVVALLPSSLLQVDSAVAVENKLLQQAIGLAKACKVYSLDHAGEAPWRLSLLVTSSYLESEEWEELQYSYPGSGEKMDWVYFLPEDFAKPKSEEVIIASPVTYKGRRIVVFSDLSGRIIRSNEYDALAATRGSIQ